MQKVTLKLRGIEQVLEGEVNEQGTVEIQGIDYELDALPVDVPVNGTIYGTLLNYQGAFEVLEPAMKEAPYKNPPKAPVLYIKPKNTFISSGKPIPLPEQVEALEIGAALGIVIGKTATKVSEKDVQEYIAGYTVVNDVSIPHESVHRPAVKEKARDGFCPIGPWIVSRDSVDNANDLRITVSINGEVNQENTTKNLIRSVEKLIADVTDYMTLYKGDVLLVGVPENAPLAKANDLVTVEIEQIGKIENRVMSEQDVIGGDTV
ncbi:fumarylacetoacetate hydrolase family protein [Pseudogracilibacillus auburnensis]|uniref:5-carboxy-2-oxohept-3-enedioate decarboxylase HpaG1 subunit n=1 Tax=Pseudogracilibacillus auburnensis TaxID=1494959 RepID=A0A2V3VPG8_9BACI|nr:fumarylacetoacetate hydrolase family protein [Pseudogracilibacillus auburnensis]PXW83747.1 5-carboxy-2-oxohept-3-enedioate decarboxylase HpaG1 subunit [Pseudogracilibacillus auburnensis]